MRSLEPSRAKQRPATGLRWVIRACLAVAWLALCSHARADKATAEALFQEGRRLMDAGEIAPACDKFRASMEAEPSVGAMLNLALCHEQLGKTASAWAEYTEAAALARHARQAEREQGARDAAARLLPQLAKLIIMVEDRSEGLTVIRNDIAVLPATYGTPLPVDPGKHLIEASAPGKRGWSTTVVIPAGPGTKTVLVPALTDAGASAEPGSASVSSPGQPGADAASGDDLGAMEIAGIAIMAVGVVGLGVGVGAGVAALDEQQGLEDDLDSGTLCPGDPTGCPAAQSRADSDIKPIAHLSTAAFVVGGAALVGGLVLFLLAPDNDAQAARIAPIVEPASAGLSVTGRF